MGPPMVMKAFACMPDAIAILCCRSAVVTGMNSTGEACSGAPYAPSYVLSSVLSWVNA